MNRIIVCLGALFMLCHSVDSLAATLLLFGTQETASPNLKPFPKWNNMLIRYEKNKANEKPCTATALRHCRIQEWIRFLENIKDKDFHTQLDEVNRFLNQAEYILDIINWGIPDYWETPYEFLRKNGDCEDYAIAKFISLRLLGVPNDAMRIVVLQDTNLNVVHAVLAIYVHERPYILDNQIKQVIPAERIFHYRPVYSINETTWWRHWKPAI